VRWRQRTTRAHYLIERYFTAARRDVTDAELGFRHALALWKIAIIAEGILHRAQQDPATARYPAYPINKQSTISLRWHTISPQMPESEAR
jgi:hypothetical protein